MVRPCGGTGARQHVCRAAGRPAPEGTSSATQERAFSRAACNTHTDRTYKHTLIQTNANNRGPHPDPALDITLLQLQGLIAHKLKEQTVLSGVMSWARGYQRSERFVGDSAAGPSAYTALTLQGGQEYKPERAGFCHLSQLQEEHLKYEA